MECRMRARGEACVRWRSCCFIIISDFGIVETTYTTSILDDMYSPY